MRKYGVMCMILLLVILLPVPIEAKTRIKQADVEITAGAYTVNVGESVTLTAQWIKQGSTCEVVWSGAEGSGIVPADGFCTSQAVFTAAQPGVYTIAADVVMRSGKSATEFTGRVECTITVLDPVKIEGVELRNVTFCEVKRADGSVRGYWAVGDVYIVKTDGTALPYSTSMEYLDADATSKNVTVTYSVDGVQYTDTVTIYR